MIGPRCRYHGDQVRRSGAVYDGSEEVSPGTRHRIGYFLAPMPDAPAIVLTNKDRTELRALLATHHDRKARCRADGAGSVAFLGRCDWDVRAARGRGTAEAAPPAPLEHVRHRAKLSRTSQEPARPSARHELREFSGWMAMAKTSTERVRETRERHKRAGMRLIQIWVPDTRSPEFAAEAARQSRITGEWQRTPEGQEEIGF